ncbi:hypothetical protein PIB30_075579 [Stylosanthes scabra]|uniref:Uncharacterized protein n=1 Tax=Stylosanthes scabra TaxID=79078 RepID=A0ABU6UNR7_9FABA|nr:hypothetical protein [Stylosanthes scabra]
MRRNDNFRAETEKTEVGIEKISPKNLREWSGRVAKPGRIGSGQTGSLDELGRTGSSSSGLIIGSGRALEMGRAGQVMGRAGRGNESVGSLKLRHVARSGPWTTYTDPMAEVASGEKSGLWTAKADPTVSVAYGEENEDAGSRPSGGAWEGFWWRGWDRWTRDGETKAVVGVVTNQRSEEGRKTSAKRGV